MNTQENHTTESNNKPSNPTQALKKRSFGISFWIILVLSIFATVAVCIEAMQPGTLSQIADDISKAAHKGGRELAITVFWKVIVPAYFIFYTILPIVLFIVIRSMDKKIAALEAHK